MRTQIKFRNKKSSSYKFISDIEESNFTITSHSKLILNLLQSMLSKTLGVMFVVKQLFTNNYLLLLHNVLFLVYFNSFEVTGSESLKVAKSYQNNKETSIKNLI